MAKEIGSLKTGGREKGTPNRKTFLLHEFFESVKFDLPLEIIKLLPTLPPEKQADVLMGLMSYLYPKRKPVEKVTHAESDKSSDEQNIDSQMSPQEMEKILQTALRSNAMRMRDKQEAKPEQTTKEAMLEIVHMAEQAQMIADYADDT